MTEFAYNNIRNASIDYISFKLNYNYHSYIFYKKDINSGFKSKLAKTSLNEFRKLKTICPKKFYHAQKL